MDRRVDQQLLEYARDIAHGGVPARTTVDSARVEARPPAFLRGHEEVMEGFWQELGKGPS